MKPDTCTGPARSGYRGAVGPWRAGLRAVLADPFEGRTQTRADPLVRGEAIVRLLRAITTSGPVLVGLENLHWADPDTLAVVEYLADHLVETAVACVMTLRSQPRPAAADLSHTLAARRNIARVALAPLDDAAVAAMVRACRPAASADRVDTVVASAEGIPFLVEEALPRRRDRVDTGGGAGMDDVVGDAGRDRV